MGLMRDRSARWLRDHCHCKECVNQDTLQRSFDSFTVRPTFRLDLTLLINDRTMTAQHLMSGPPRMVCR